MGRLFSAIRPTLTSGESGEISLSFSVDKIKAEMTLNGIFDYLASKKNRVVIAFDEFQQILEYPEKGTEALLRSRIQFLENVNFIFFGIAASHHG